VPLRLPARPRALPADLSHLRTVADQAFSRTAGAPLVGGNAVRVLRDATENYPVWEQAILEARHTVHIEMYIFHRDDVGRRFVDLLASRAKAGVAVRVVYDWFGCGMGPRLGLFRPLVAAGGEVRAFNPPTLSAAFGWLRRDHRKLITVDGRVAFVSGLCIGSAWLGDPAKRREPWRDTGLEIIGPAVPYADDVFAESWRLAGGNPADCVAGRTPDATAGTVSLRLIPTEPFQANLLRMDLLVATLARKSLWITDAYFIGTGAYLEALKRAAHDGVDVRLLLPRDSDVRWTVPVSRSLYRPLLEAGVRIFEWNSTMVHAKTAVADGRWARIGSTNLNLNSWIGNWELDVAIEDDRVARTLQTHYEEDLARSTEIVLKGSQVSVPSALQREEQAAPPNRRQRSSRRVARAVTGVGRSLGAAVTGNRPLENFEARPLFVAGAFLLAVGITAFVAPRAVAWPLALLAAYVGITFVVEAWSTWRRRP
jgi:phosphatidylserine/phosphatidylglycerophosphate/cardiolipin synthase-like enzyme